MSFVVAGAACCKNTGEASGGAVGRAAVALARITRSRRIRAPPSLPDVEEREVASMCETK